MSQKFTLDRFNWEVYILISCIVGAIMIGIFFPPHLAGDSAGSEEISPQHDAQVAAPYMQRLSSNDKLSLDFPYLDKIHKVILHYDKGTISEDGAKKVMMQALTMKCERKLLEDGREVPRYTAWQIHRFVATSLSSVDIRTWVEFPDIK